MSSKLSPDLEKEVLEKAAQGWSSRRISAWLQAERSVKLSHVSVAAYLDKGKAEREVVAKAVVREKLATALIPGLDLLAEQASKARRLCNRYFKRAMSDGEGDIDAAHVYLKALEGVRKLVETQLHFGGAGKPDAETSELAEAHDRVAGRIDRLAASRAAKGAPAGDSPDPAGSGGP